MATSSRPAAAPESAEVEALAGLWWLKVITAGCWLLLSVIVFRFDYTTVSAISILFGIVMLAAAATELVAIFVSHGWWRLAHGVLALAFVVIGIIAFVHPGNTFAALAGVMSFYFIFAGALRIALAVALRDPGGFHWLLLAVGVAELLLGFWAAGYFGRSALLLVIWVGALALARGIGDIIDAFALRRLRDV
ncbi:MAG TPA: DUF308 domain-containing protein [Gaiellaceae bacterium]|jgi:uncharacterized membrane protein HdeD (DUF308 family)|nr:DUF308 domain-containing protein [Gaiellaceae bacterium]